MDLTVATLILAMRYYRAPSDTRLDNSLNKTKFPQIQSLIKDQKNRRHSLVLRCDAAESLQHLSKRDTNKRNAAETKIS